MAEFDLSNRDVPNPEVQEAFKLSLDPQNLISEYSQRLMAVSFADTEKGKIERQYFSIIPGNPLQFSPYTSLSTHPSYPGRWLLTQYGERGMAAPTSERSLVFSESGITYTLLQGAHGHLILYNDNGELEQASSGKQIDGPTYIIGLVRNSHSWDLQQSESGKSKSYWAELVESATKVTLLYHDGNSIEAELTLPLQIDQELIELLVSKETLANIISASPDLDASWRGASLEHVTRIIFRTHTRKEQPKSHPDDDLLK